MNQFIAFRNSTPLPVIVEAWERSSYRMNILEHTRIEPYETVVLHSIVGEWATHTLFEREEDMEAWKKAGFARGCYLGKFRSNPCASGNYAWMENNSDNDFELLYTPFKTPVHISEDEHVDGLITFSHIFWEWEDVQEGWLPEQFVGEPSA